jgi:hypothetical protein
MCQAMSMVTQGIGMGANSMRSGSGGYATAQAEKYNMNTEKQKAKVSLMNAKSSYESGMLETEKEASTRQQAISAGTASFAANGVQIDGGPADAATMWKEDQNTMLGRDLTIIMRNAQAEAWNYSNESKMHKAQAKLHKMNKNFAYVQGAIGAMTGS